MKTVLVSDFKADRMMFGARLVKRVSQGTCGRITMPVNQQSCTGKPWASASRHRWFLIIRPGLIARANTRSTTPVLLDFEVNIIRCRRQRILTRFASRARTSGRQCASEVVEDNAPPHNNMAVTAAREEAGYQRSFPPGNSPDLNPTETVWRKLKAGVKKTWARSHQGCSGVSKDFS